MPSEPSSNLPTKILFIYLAVLAGVLLFLTLAGCTHIPDKPVCMEISMTRGFCTNTVSDKEFFIDEDHPYSFTGDAKDAKTWWQMRPFMLLVPADSWAAFKIYIIQECKRTNCDQFVQSWDRKINDLDPGNQGITAPLTPP